jgi:hypothetical protein
MTRAAAAAVVRATALANTPESLSRLTTYAPDTRPEVQRELAMAWHYFNPELYARKVLADAPLNHGSIQVEHADQVPHLPLLRNLKNVIISIREPQNSLDFLRGMPSSNHIYCHFAGEVALAPLKEHRKIRTLLLNGAERYTSLEILASLPRLSTLHLYQREEFEDYRFLRKVERLEALAISRTKSPFDFTQIEGLRKLSEFTIIGGSANFSTIPELPNLRELGVLAMTELVDMRPLAGRSLTIVLTRDDKYLGLDELGPNIVVRYL